MDDVWLVGRYDDGIRHGGRFYRPDQTAGERAWDCGFGLRSCDREKGQPRELEKGLARSREDENTTFYIAAKFIVNRTTVCLSCILSISFVRDKPVRIPARGNFSIKTSKFAA